MGNSRSSPPSQQSTHAICPQRLDACTLSLLLRTLGGHEQDIWDLIQSFLAINLPNGAIVYNAGTNLILVTTPSNIFRPFVRTFENVTVYPLHGDYDCWTPPSVVESMREDDPDLVKFLGSYENDDVLEGKVYFPSIVDAWDMLEFFEYEHPSRNCRHYSHIVNGCNCRNEMPSLWDIVLWQSLHEDGLRRFIPCRPLP